MKSDIPTAVFCSFSLVFFRLFHFHGLKILENLASLLVFLFSPPPAMLLLEEDEVNVLCVAGSPLLSEGARSVTGVLGAVAGSGGTEPPCAG